MLTTDDILSLFSAMRISYHGQWRQGGEAVESWRRALSGFDAPQIRRAADKCIDIHPNHPPSLAQFKALLRGALPRPTTYLPAPDTAPAVCAGNAAIYRILERHGGVDGSTLRTMIALKNALAEDWGSEPVSDEYYRDVASQLDALAARHDTARKDEEILRARRRMLPNFELPQ